MFSSVHSILLIIAPIQHSTSFPLVPIAIGLCLLKHA